MAHTRRVQVGVAICGLERKKGRVDVPRHLLIDGYNILHAWHWMHARDTGAGLDVVRTRLVEAVRPIHDVERIRVTIVFDGQGAVSGCDAAASEAGFAVVFAPSGRTADDLIESLVAGSQDPAACVVATADALERETVAASGASCLSPVDLKEWADRCRLRAVQAAKRRAETTQKHWGNRLPL